MRTRSERGVGVGPAPVVALLNVVLAYEMVMTFGARRIDLGCMRSDVAAVEQFATTTRMVLLGVSHAASEFLVMNRGMQVWFRERFAVATIPLREPHWWR